MFNAFVSKKTFEVQPDGDGYKVNGQPFEYDLQKISEGKFHIIFKNRSFNAEIVRVDRAAKSFVIKINGKLYPVELKDRFDLLLEKMGMNTSGAGKVNNVKAPMPGLIIDLKVTAGDVVKQGDILLILEAMKMENIIKSPGEGIVRSVKIKKGESVEKNQVLIEF
jgi:biotin carboxyl carrier protein